jgi:hypothetical protein
MTARRIQALCILAWAVVVMLWKRVFGRGPRGLALFHANFAADGLFSLTPDERKAMGSFGRCIACARCNAGDGERMIRSAGAYPGTMSLMLAASRGMPDFGFAAPALTWITDDELAEKERICPADVPMRQIAAFVRAHRDAGAGGGPPLSSDEPVVR